MSKTILVCGGRDFGRIPPKTEESVRQYRFIFETLERICHERDWVIQDEYRMPDVSIVNGAAKGADEVSSDWAIVNWIVPKEYPADWKTHGKAAGPIRNKQMLDSEEIDLVIAFPGGSGTNNMVTQAKARGIEVLEVTYD